MTGKRQSCLLAIWIVMGGLTFGLPQHLRADGFRNPFQGSAASGQGTAFTAQADDASAIHYNPAGMTQLPGIQLAFGLFFQNQTVRFRSTTGATARGDLGGTVGLPPPGWFYLTANLKDRGIRSLGDLTVGLGVQSPFGFLIEYPEDGPFATAVTQSTLPVLTIKPTLAYKLHDRLSIGLGADIFTFAQFLGEGHFEQQFIASGNIPGTAAGDKLEINGTGTTAGLNASLLFTPLRTAAGKPRVNLGFIWRSQAVLPLEGKLLANGAEVAKASTQIRFPEIYTWGLAGWPIRNRETEWKLEVDVDYARWQSIRTSDVKLSNGAMLGNPQRLMNTVNLAVGIEYKWLHLPDHPSWELALRSGYLHSAKAFSDFSFRPDTLDGPFNAYTLGIGFLCKGSGLWLWLFPCGDKERMMKAIGLDFHYHYLQFEPRTVVGNVNPTADGRYRTRIHAGSFTLRFNF